jgi:predicted amidohydrolase
MARLVRVSTLCPTPHSIDLQLNYNDAVKEMINYWNYQFSRVLPDKPDLIVTYESCDCPSNYSRVKCFEYFKVRGDRIRDFMREIAAKNSCYIAYSSDREEIEGIWRNSTQIIDRTGEIAGIYDKNHLVITENTRDGILYGTDALIIQCDFGTVGCAICFDLNFDELRLKYVKKRPDLIIFSSMYHGGLMQNYWAYSCRAHFVGSISGSGCPGTIISPVGETIAKTTNYFKYVTKDINLDCKVVHLGFNREKIIAAKNKYGEMFKISDPGYLGAILISSESNEITIDDIIKEFEIELLDDYFERCRVHRNKNIKR